MVQVTCVLRETGVCTFCTCEAMKHGRLEPLMYLVCYPNYLTLLRKSAGLFRETKRLGFLVDTRTAISTIFDNRANMILLQLQRVMRVKLNGGSQTT